MNYCAFCESLAAEVGRVSDGALYAVPKKIMQNNGVTEDALELRNDYMQLSPVISPERYYLRYQDGVPVKTLAEELVKNYCDAVPRAALPADFLENYDRVRGSVFCKCINYERNRELLKDVPHRKWLDLAIVCYYQIDESMLENASVLLRQGHADHWDITGRTLLDHAWKNTIAHKKSFFCRLSDLLAAWGSGKEKSLPEESNPLYLLSNEEKCFGAVCLAYPGEAEKIRSILKKDYYVLPSSIHECLILTAEEEYPPEMIRSLVREVNANHVRPQEVLSDEIYYYDPEKKKLRVYGR